MEIRSPDLRHAYGLGADPGSGAAGLPQL